MRDLTKIPPPMVKVPKRRHDQTERVIRALRAYHDAALGIGVLQASAFRRDLFRELERLNRIDFGESS